MKQALATPLNRHALDPDRSRWRKPLDAADVAWCRENGVLVGYDPTQIGWVTLASAASDEEAPDPGRLRLRPWREADVASFVTLLDDPEVWRHLPEPYPAPLTAALARDLIGLATLADHHVVRAVERGGEPVGQVRLAFVPAATDRTSGEISYWLGRRWWGRGIASEALRRFSARCFAEQPDLTSIHARVHRDNAASMAVLRKAGYLDEGSAPDDLAVVVFRRRRGGRAGN